MMVTSQIRIPVIRWSLTIAETTDPK